MLKQPAYFKWLSATARQYAWAPISLFGAHMFVFTQTNWYEKLYGIDKPIHFIGGFVIAYFWYGAYLTAKELKLLGKPNRLLGQLLVLFATATATVLWEFHEYLADTYLGTTMQASIGDTMGDMLLGILGGLLLIAALRNQFE